MTTPTAENRPTRREVLAGKRQSRRPSRLGTAAGTAPKPDRVLDEDAGFPGLLNRVWHQASTAPDLSSAVDTLLTLDGHVPADVQLRALRPAEEVALEVLFGVSWRDGTVRARTLDMLADRPGQVAAYVGGLGLTRSGRVVVGVPARGPLDTEQELLNGFIRVPWSADALAVYQREMSSAADRIARSTADCRDWLAAAGPDGRDEILEQLKDAALRTAPFILYQDDRQYTNFRDRNNLVGKTLWPGHPDCVLSGLQGVALELWSDSDVVLVVCLALLVRSAGYARIEEVNGTQLTVGHVAGLLERIRRRYNEVGGRIIEAAQGNEIAVLDPLARALRERRQEIVSTVQLYREIHGALLHKIERVAGPAGESARERERALCTRLCERLPVFGSTLEELGTGIAASPAWLARPHGDFGTGLESLVYETVAAARAAFNADFAMSRGLRSLPALISALREGDWARITKWDIPEFFCCVVPDPAARRYFDDSPAQLADVAWAMSARMQYNSWHFIAANLPKVPVVVARDYFVPPVIPDLAYYSDQHHRGHVAARVRFSIRSPQPVDVLDRRFTGFVDLRLLRCDGDPFDEQDLVAAHHASGFIAAATGHAATLAADGEPIEVTSFDTQWHWTTIAGSLTGVPPAGGAGDRTDGRG